MTIAPVQRNALGDQVAARLRLLIVTGQLPAGYRLVEASLSADFGVSRGPVRDALGTLQSEGLVAVQGRGLSVVGLTAEDLVELFSLRRTLETFALRECAAAADPVWSPAEDRLAELDQAADDGDAVAFAHADLAFHTSLYHVAGHRRLLRVWNGYRPTFAALLEVATSQDRDLHPSADSHRLILERVRAGDVAAAERELVDHLEGARARLERFRAAHHDEQDPG
ncbi:GntR family transcriptional regulator [Ruania alkalisoli]|uniref:GntR family transcriptional regulator n=1 Tax=Ruania alkalisoli TaxID=2779775 RepID=A0A7M1T0R4_9MICO|nr:GntR family transcriptional regulator [Ruania alkalisoli]